MAAEPIPQVNPSAPAAPKFILRSKTVLGAIILALPGILATFGIAFSDAAAQHWLQIVTSVLGFLGVVWGRVTAQGPVHFGKEAFLRFVDACFLLGIAAIVLTTLGGCEMFRPRVSLEFIGEHGERAGIATDGKSIRFHGGIDLDGQQLDAGFAVPLKSKHTGGLAK